MRLYSGSAQQFVDDVTNARIVPTLTAAFEGVFGWTPTPSERTSWSNSLEKVRNLLSASGLWDTGVMLEYLLPASSRRLDCMVAGQSGDGVESAVIIELKQWLDSRPSDLPSAIETRFRGRYQDHLHPSVQVGQYEEYLRDFQTVFQPPNEVKLASCAYLHNYAFDRSDPLLDPKFHSWVARYPLFGEHDFDRVRKYVENRISGGHGLEVLRKIEGSTVRPSIEFIKHLEDVLTGDERYKLLDEQRLVFDRVLTSLEGALTKGQRAAVIAKGGPGTGKTVIAVNLLAELMKRRSATAQLVTGSGAFTRSLREATSARVGRLIKFTNNYVNAGAGQYDALVVDEAHRIRPVSTDFYRRKTSKQEDHQVDEILRASKVSVFFIDDFQAVTPEDVGRSGYIRDRAERQGIPVHEYELSIQFRCRGADSFVAWLDSTLGLTTTEVPKWRDPPGFSFRVMASAIELDAEINRLNRAGKSARLTAGFCWKWSSPNPDGSLPMDVQIDGLARPWNAREGRTKAARAGPGIPPSQLWATSPGGVGQVGCIYTAQGFEFDYVGVIFGNDLVFDPAANEWRGVPSASKDPRVKRAKDFTRLVKQVYRVLMSRGIEGCFVYFVDAETRRFVESRIALG